MVVGGRQLAGRWDRAMGPSLSLRARGSVSVCPFAVLRAATCCLTIPGRCRVLAETEDREVIIERVAALDIGKAEVMCCVRVPAESGRGRRLQEVAAYPTMTRSLLRLADRLGALGVTRVVLECTGGYVRR